MPKSDSETLTRARLTIVTTYFWPEKTGISQVTWEMATYLAAQDIVVTVVTAMPFYPAWRIDPEYRAHRRLWLREKAGSISILRSWHWVRPNPNTVLRLAHEGTLSLFSLPNLVRGLRNADHAFIITPHLTFAFVASVLAGILRVPQTVIVQDVMPDAAIELGMLRNRALIAFSRGLARGLYQRARDILTLSEGMRQRIATLCDSGKIHLLPNTIDADELAPPAVAENEFRKRFVPPGVFAVIHTGNMGRKQDLDLILRAAERVQHDASIHFYVFGDGAEKDRFVARMKLRNLKNVSHHPLQERSLLPHMLAGADMVVVSQLPEVVDIVVPSKLLTAMGAGSAILAACDPASELARLVVDSDGGVVIPPSDADALVAAIDAFRREPAAVARRRRLARAYATEHFDRNRVFEKLLSRLPVINRDRSASPLGDSERVL